MTERTANCLAGRIFFHSPHRNQSSSCRSSSTSHHSGMGMLLSPSRTGRVAQQQSCLDAGPMFAEHLQNHCPLNWRGCATNDAGSVTASSSEAVSSIAVGGCHREYSWRCFLTVLVAMTDLCHSVLNGGTRPGQTRNAVTSHDRSELPHLNTPDSAWTDAHGSQQQATSPILPSHLSSGMMVADVPGPDIVRTNRPLGDKEL